MQANESLFAALSQTRVKDLNRQRKQFKACILQFNAEQEKLSASVEDSPGLSASLAEIHGLSERFFALAEKVMTAQKQNLIIQRRLVEAEIQFQSQSEMRCMHGCSATLPASLPDPRPLKLRGTCLQR